MLKALKKTLADAVCRDKDGLNANGFALRLTDFLIKNGVPDNTRLLQIVYKDTETRELPIYNDTISRDGRICKLLLANVRQYSISDPFNFYTLDFSGSGHPISSIFHGANGSGKSTIFATMEYLYLGKSEYAAAHGHQNDQFNFFKSINSSEIEPTVLPYISGIGFVKGKKLDGFEIPAAFCSECDYFEITRHWDKLNDYISRQIGYEEFHELIKRLKYLSKKLQLSRQYNVTSSNIDELMNNETDEVDPIIKQEIQVEINKHKIKLATFQAEYDEIDLPGLGIGIEKLSLDEKGKLIEEKVLDDISNTYRILEIEWKNVLSEFRDIADSVFDKMMKDSMFSDKESLEIKLADTVITPILHINKIKGSESSSSEVKKPVEYFNTFRLKLFCMAFKMALYCCAKIKQQVNIPFVVDDVFDSSDFSNRSKIGNVVYKMIESHDQIMKERNLVLPLQFIFFTQDNIIGENIYHGFRNFAYSKGEEQELFVKYSRIFRPHDLNLPEDINILESSDLFKLLIDGKEYIIAKIEDSI